MTAPETGQVPSPTRQKNSSRKCWGSEICCFQGAVSLNSNIFIYFCLFFVTHTQGTILLLSNIEVSSCCISVDFPSCCTMYMSVRIRRVNLYLRATMFYTIHGTNLIYFCDDTIQFLLDVLFTKSVLILYLMPTVLIYFICRCLHVQYWRCRAKITKKSLYEPNDERLANGFIYFLLSQTLHNTSTSYSYRYSFYSDQGRS